MKKCPRCGAEYSNTTTLCPADGTALETTGDPLIGKTLGGKYRVDERISVGGMGAVYRGTHILMGKKVAVKVLRPSLAADQTIVARFSREARAASKISHPHALSVTDFGEAEGGVVFLVMELINGRTLKEVIREEGPLPLPRVVEIIRQVGSALDSAHAEGVIHRDLKSDNIMLLNTGGADYAKVLDFGIAKIQEPVGGHDPGLTSPDLIIGTPQYMSPEQCSQVEELDARSDVYSFGVILYEMLVGQLPFTAESPTGIMLKHLQEPPPRVLDVRPHLPRGVGTVVARALAKRRDDRYQSAGELVEDLIIAAGAGLLQPQPVARGPEPNRIVVPTRSGPAAEVDAEGDDITVVRTRPGVEPIQLPRVPARAPVPAPATSFNPWRIIIPSVAGLLVIFAVIYAFTRNSDPSSNRNANAGASTLTADPNSQAVQPLGTPLGKSEQGIPTGGVIPNANSTHAATPTPVAETNANENTNANDNRDTNTNSNRPQGIPSPGPADNSNQAPKASPQPTVEALPPPPLPKPTPSVSAPIK